MCQFWNNLDKSLELMFTQWKHIINIRLDKLNDLQDLIIFTKTLK